jgi:lambda family phage minor tail protein L
MPELIATTAEQIQSSDFGAIVTLYVVDATNIGGEVYRFTTGTWNGEVILFDGEPYAPIPAEITGLKWDGQGAIPSPTLKASNIDGQFVQALLNNGNLVGANVTIIKTFDQFLDNGDNPDPLARFPDEQFIIDSLVANNNKEVSWKLTALFDVRGLKLPRRQILRDTCTHRYRRYVDGSFDYTGTTCPYVGTQSYDLENNPVAESGDICNKLLSGCQIRFGENAILPTRAFPGAARIRDRA